MITCPVAPSGRRAMGASISAGSDGKKLTKVLLNVTVERSLGPLHVLISPESSVADLIGAAVDLYVKERRRPLLVNSDPREFELHYNQYTLERLNEAEKVINLGSRNFFVCSRGH